jgi:TRAP-type uncharacterized transport system substrate-binding protein
MKSIKTSMTIMALAVLACAQVSAQKLTPTAAADPLRIATGKKGKGYSKLFADIQSVCGAQLALTEVETEGGLQNLTTLAANKADLGFVQLDTLQDLKASDEAIGALQALLPLNVNLLHIVGHVDGYSYDGPERLWGLRKGKTTNVVVGKFSHLRGLPVAVVGSARALGRAIDRGQAMALQFVDVDTDEQAFAKLKAGEVAAVLSTSGWPSGPIQKLKRDSGMRLLPFDAAVQPPYQLVRKNYDNLDAFNHSFLAAPNLLVTHPFTVTGVKGKAVAALQNCIVKNLVTLQEGQFESAWREVRNTSDTYGWSRFGAGAGH